MPTPITEPQEVEMLELRKAALVYRAINHKLRQKMIQLIYKKEPVTVTAIYTNLRIEQSVVSQHLGILRRAGLVHAEKEGKHVYYTINTGRLEQLHSSAEELIKNNAKKPT
ncbi:MAG: helix-turn-helix transcriptional regulator [Flavisolibacter sp.]|jgi:DNA-binding transcriptional ArsR family regulator|nr:helix-turn-helix transcriptional regulator [Flavisolibacter sp.]